MTMGDGVVTREHRRLALRATYPDANLYRATWDSERLWVKTGENGGVGYTPHLFLPRIAQAIADAEARGAARTPPAELTILTCAYCGQEYPAGTPASGGDVAALTGHIAVCGKHPMRELTAEVERLRAELRDHLMEDDALRELLLKRLGAGDDRATVDLVAAVCAPPVDEVAGLSDEFLRLRDVLQTAVLPLGRSRAELVAMLDRIENYRRSK